MLSDNAEDYLECIYDLTRGNSPAKTKDIAARLNVSPASVTEMIQRLSKEGYLDYKKYKGVTLTSDGFALASKIKRRHRLLEKFLVDVLGVRREKGAEEACRLEHIVSDESVRGICQLMNQPGEDLKELPYPECEETCNRVMGEDAVTLDLLNEGEKGVITHLRCENPRRVRRLISMGLVPGRKVQLEESIPMGGPLLVRTDDSRVALAKEYARMVFVKRCT